MSKKSILAVAWSVAVCAIATALLGLTVQADEAEHFRKVGNTLWKDGPLDSTAVDWSLFPKAYGILANERLMYPVDISDWPVKIGPERQLFVDNYLVASADAVRRMIHQPVKFPDNPIMEEVAGEHNVIPNTVIWDPDKKKYRMWYATQIYFPMPGKDVQGEMPSLYAESDDGIHWVRPKLGVLEYKGSKDNNWVAYGPLMLIHHPYAEGHPKSEDLQRQYMGLVYYWSPQKEKEGLYLHASPDGLRWTQVREEPIITMMSGGKHFPLQGLGDTSLIRYDTILKRYVCDTKILFKPKFRTRGIMTSEDLVHWTRPRMTIYPDTLDLEDAEIYSNTSFTYEGMWLGLHRVLSYAHKGRKRTHVELTCSRDGLHWSRVGNREHFLALGDEDSWERDYTDPASNGPFLVGNELWFFYRGSRTTGVSAKFKTFYMKAGLAKLRRDGFASIDAEDQPGTLVTRPLTPTGKTLHLNAKVSKGGWIRVAALGPKGEPIADYALEDCQPVEGDATKVQVNWNAGSDLSAALASQDHVRLQFQMKQGELYSFWIE